MKIYRNPDAKWREEDKFREQAHEGLSKGEDVSDIGTSIILHSGKMHSFNLLGTEIWKLCDGRALDEIVSELKEKFEVDGETLRKDVVAFLEQLKRDGLVHEE
jgi:GeoRSP system PqqD family protein